MTAMHECVCVCEWRRKGVTVGREKEEGQEAEEEEQEAEEEEEEEDGVIAVVG